MQVATVSANMEGELSAIESCSLSEQIVLLALADAAVCGETPVASVDIRPRCLELTENAETETVSTPNESDIMRALSVLGTEPYVSEIQSETSPVGKGRPQYDLATDPEPVLDVLATEDRLERPVERIRSD